VSALPVTKAGSSARSRRAGALAETPLEDSKLTRLLGYNLSRADIRLRQFFHRYMEQFGVRPSEYSALVLIASNSRLNQKKLGEALDISAPNLAVLLDKLTARGMLVRVRSEEDRRAQHLHLTAKGRGLLARAESSILRMEERVFSALSAGERALLIELLQKIISAPRLQLNEDVGEENSA
jgi:DNA-binding MarR family transcriptional regulator